MAKKKSKEKSKEEAAAAEEATVSEDVQPAKPPGKKKRKAAEAEASQEEPKAAEEEKPSKKRKKAQAAEAEEGQENGEQREWIGEEARRTAQMEIRALVVKMRAEGKSEKQIEKAKQEIKAKYGGSLSKPGSNRDVRSQQAKERRESKAALKQQKYNMTRSRELVIIPVIWRGRHDKDDLQRTAQEIKDCVAQAGVDAWIDSRRHYTPGQKFAHWEHRGVMLRIEVGPDDLQKGVCQVCRAKKPGEYKTVEKKKVQLPPAGAKSLLLLLKSWGLKKIPVIGELEDDDVEDVVQAKSEGPVPMPEGADDMEGNWAPREPTGSMGKKKKAR